jgi:L-methionine (R)-S-oxide reductase
MAETIPDLRSVPKPAAYEELRGHCAAILDGTHDDISAMSTISALVHHAFGNLWTGFYRVVEPGQMLRVGPYQGSLGCIDISFGRGVCGTAAAECKTIIVDDVEEFPGHIACDARARSEIVVPVFGRSGDLVAVFDVDSDRTSAFDDADKRGLERILSWFSTQTK